MCGLSLEEIFFANPGGDVWLLLAQQYITAKLNLANAAASAQELDWVMSTAAIVLSSCDIALPAEADALALAQMLKAYNLGEIGPGPCAG
jgi:hypothetical protein